MRYAGGGDWMDEHNEPEKYCRAPLCRHTNWGGYGRLHFRDGDCPPYDPDPRPNELADFWEGVRRLARQNWERAALAENPDAVTDKWGRPL